MDTLSFYKSVESYLEGKISSSSILSSLPSPVPSSVALSMVNTLWLWGTQIDSKDDRWTSLSRFVRELSTLKVGNMADTDDGDNTSNVYMEMVTLMRQCLEVNIIIVIIIIITRFIMIIIFIFR